MFNFTLLVCANFHNDVPAGVGAGAPSLTTWHSWEINSTNYGLRPKWERGLCHFKHTVMLATQSLKHTINSTHTNLHTWLRYRKWPSPLTTPEELGLKNFEPFLTRLHWLVHPLATTWAQLLTYLACVWTTCGFWLVFMGTMNITLTSLTEKVNSPGLLALLRRR